MRKNFTKLKVGESIIVGCYEIFAMPLDRSSWIEAVRNAIGGALGEYAKKLYAPALDFSEQEISTWDNEVKKLVTAFLKFLGPKAKTTSKFNRVKALEDAKNEAKFLQIQILNAKNDVLKYVSSKSGSKALKKANLILSKMDLKSEQLVDQLFSEYVK